MSDPLDLEALIGPGALGYFAGGAGSEITLRDNLASWSRYALHPRVLVDVSERDLGTTLLGRYRPHPVVVAPMAYQKHAHEVGELGTAEAAARTESLYVLSSQTTTSPPDVARAMEAVAPGSDRWFQLYVFRDRAVSHDLVVQARESGYEALVITVDFPVAGWRERDRRTGFTVEHPVALNPSGPPLTTEQLFAMHDPSLTWDDIGEFADAAGMPVVLKGILRPDDAERAVDSGAAGIIVSNHGGRQLDTTLSGIDALVPIAQAVGGSVDLLVDGGVTRGWDVAKALALGADAVLIGRHLLWGLARGGAQGAEDVLRQVLAELDSTLALLGCPAAADLDASYVGPRAVG
ncbi:alpha-hydroxy acid oxidase [Aeromicrobium alkaliterrae]|uniref:Alpha-hydroxy acid oxidase n=1 Tax=Aeromicrobium alkaliterrae TaxID=302168 RepID=A0ABP4VIJ1_9ACTN